MGLGAGDTVVLLGLVGVMKLSSFGQIWEDVCGAPRMGIGRSLHSHRGKAYEVLYPEEGTASITLVASGGGGEDGEKEEEDNVGSFSDANSRQQSLLGPAYHDYGTPLLLDFSSPWKWGSVGAVLLTIPSPR